MINVQFNVTLSPYEMGEARLLDLLRCKSSEIDSGDMTQGQLDAWLKRLLLAAYALEGLDKDLPRKLAHCDNNIEVIDLLMHFLERASQLDLPGAGNANELGLCRRTVDLDLLVKHSDAIRTTVQSELGGVVTQPVTEPNMSLGNIEAYAKIARSSIF
ncbi:hypothetical protein ACP3V3_02520 [Vibrio sp. PNB22_3_1]